jgi:hypothetical protein
VLGRHQEKVLDILVRQRRPVVVKPAALDVSSTGQ